MVGENLQGGAEESDWRDRGASPVNSRTSTLCLLVDTVTGTQEEPDGKEKDMEEGMQYHLSFIRGQGELGKVLYAVPNCKRRMLNR